MYNIRVIRRKAENKIASTVLKKSDIGMQQMFEELSRILQVIDFKECKIWISSNKNNWALKRKNEPELPFE